MAQPHSTAAESFDREEALLGRLLALYAEEERIYRRVLELSRQQGRIIAAGEGFLRLREVLEQKRDCLAAVARLERTENSARERWTGRQHEWSAGARARLHQALQAVAALIEEILTCEEQNDRVLLEKTSCY